MSKSYFLGMIVFFFMTSSAVFAQRHVTTIFDAGVIIARGTHEKKKEEALYVKEPVANVTAQILTAIAGFPVGLPFLVVGSPIHYGTNITHLENTSVEGAITTGYWTLYTVIGLPVAVAEYSLYLLPKRAFLFMFNIISEAKTTDTENSETTTKEDGEE